MQTRRQAILKSTAAAATLGLGSLPTFAQKMDTLKIIVGFPPGGTTDAFARRVGEKLRGIYANNVIIENRPGAGGQLGVNTLKASPGDGTVMLYTPASMLTVYPHSYSKLAYSQADVAPISIGHATDHAFVVGSAVPAEVTNLKQYVAWAKANPGKVNVGNPGAGSMPHLLAGRFATLADIQSTNVPFPGSGPGVPQVLGGQLAAMSSPLGDWVQHAKTGRVRILATSGATRSPFVDNVPTYKEQGFDELVIREWFGFFLPATASQAVRERASTFLRASLIQPDVVAAMAPLAAHVDPVTIDQFASRLKADSEFAGKLVKALGFRADS
ncbi:tripartite tricarboxylate transporter substrate-binding protein [Variovorax sp. PCZ-1]|uniref:tripartite tricarboxylate transporter substrate-binding protein n=1 Tax=Variovorax sp. PCZ-1 TaxID=2835533 RepID=UPI001BCCB994|nr:tripartite tricarboxylate transporter substrate-binding protein [Variovorax sp. PCZ-1]MBS7806908.1 twin-arginine translocation pathway signal protein [Variovorax sp. PCZ-1]